MRERLEKRNLGLDRFVTNFRELIDDIASDYKEMKLRAKTAFAIKFAQGPSAVCAASVVLSRLVMMNVSGKRLMLAPGAPPQAACCTTKGARQQLQARV